MITADRAFTANDIYALQLQRELRDTMSQGSVVTLTYDSGSRSEQRRWDTPATIVCLSPDAQSLNKEQIALELLLGNRATKPAAIGSPKPNATAQKQPVEATTSSANPSRPSLTDFLKLSAADQFYLTTNPDDLAAGMSEEQAASFKAAYEAKTLNIRDVSQVPELSYRATVTYFDAGTGRGEAGSITWDAKLAGEEYGPNCFLGGGVGGGGIFVSW